MIKLFLEKIGIEVRPCRNPWADNRHLQAKLIAARFNCADAERRHLDLRGQLLAATSRERANAVKYNDACLRIIELEDEVNEWAVKWAHATETPITPPYDGSCDGACGG